ncbi:MAG: hypothetical protein ACREDE_09620, partial [Thermoplasmata archaeon]
VVSKRLDATDPADTSITRRFARRPVPSPVLAACFVCHALVRRNKKFVISFCPVHGLSQPILAVPLNQRRLPGL